MKTLTTKLAAAFILVLLSFVTFQSSASEKKDEIPSITDISASGHVYVYVKKGDVEKIEVVPGYNKDNTVIEVTEGTLRIASVDEDELIIVVTVTDLASIAADGSAFVHVLTDLDISARDIFVADDAAVLLKTSNGEQFISNKK